MTDMRPEAHDYSIKNVFPRLGETGTTPGDHRSARNQERLKCRGFRSLSYFFGGAFLANAIPHFVSGMMGRPFQSPFAKPPGQGLSSSTVNVLWGFFNIVVGYVLVCRVGDFELRDTATSSRSASACSRWRSSRARISAASTAAMRRSVDDGSICGRLPIPGRIQLSSLGRRRLRLQRRHLDAAHGPGLAGAHPAHPSRRFGRRPGHGAAVRAAAPLAALDRLRRRSFQSAQAADRHAGDDGRPRAGAGRSSPSPAPCSSGTSTSSPFCSAAPRRSMRRCARPSSRNWWATRTCTMRSRSTRPRSTPARMIGPPSPA